MCMYIISPVGLEVDTADAEVVPRSCEARDQLQSLAVGVDGLRSQRVTLSLVTSVQ